MTRTLLLEENPLVVQPSLAVAIGGLNEAIILQQVHYWLNNSKHSFNGRKWIYNSMSEWSKQFPFWSIKTVQRAFKSLIDLNIILTANFNKTKIDKTIWYSIDYEALSKIVEGYFTSIQKEQDTDIDIEPNKSNSSPRDNTTQSNGQNDHMERVNLPFPCGQNDQSIWSDCPNHMDNLGIPIPETTTETNTENNYSQSISQSDIDKASKDKEGLTEDKLTEKQLLEQILDKCDIESTCEDKSIAKSVTTAIQNLYYNSAFAQQNLGLPLEVVRDNLKSLDSETIAYAVTKMQKEAACGKTIFSPVKYLQSCIYNAISEYPASLLVDPYLAQMEVDSKRSIQEKPVKMETSKAVTNNIINLVKGTKYEQPVKELAQEMSNIFEQYLATARIDFRGEFMTITADSEFSASLLECRYKEKLLEKFKPLGVVDIEIVFADSISA